MFSAGRRLSAGQGAPGFVRDARRRGLWGAMHYQVTHTMGTANKNRARKAVKENSSGAAGQP